MNEGRLRLAILQRVCPGYRAPLFRRLSASPDMDATLFIGDDIPSTKVRSGHDLHQINLKRLRTSFLRLGSRMIPWHRGLIGELRRLRPHVILCEGESHFLGYLQAIAYKFLFDRKVALMHWCFISLPGEPDGGRQGLRYYIKAFFRRFFDAFVLYSSFGKASLMRLGQPEDKLFVATNVGDTDRFLRLSAALADTPSEARRRLGLPERFTALYLGTLDPNKRPDLFLDLARGCDPTQFNFVLLGEGPLLAPLRDRVATEQLSNVFLPGNVSEELPRYLRAANVLLIPGRGGIIISEAMASGVPVVVHQADGTEYDLLRDGETGVLLRSDTAAEFRRTVEYLRANPGHCSHMGENARKLVAAQFTTERQASEIQRAAHYAASQKIERSLEA